jgi:AraC family transcriptional regulator of arabinose operon
MIFKRESFETHFSAGKTIFSESHAQPVYRPFGMDRWIINLTLSGGGEINQGKNKFMVTKGDLLLFPPGVKHDYQIADGHADWVHLWAYFSDQPLFTGLLAWPEVNSGVLRLGLNDKKLWQEVAQTMLELIEIYHSSYPRKLDFCLNYLHKILLLCDLKNPNISACVDSRIPKAIDYFNRNLDKNISIKNVADYCSLSESRLAHLFKESTGVSPGVYFNELKLEKARQLLISTSKSISEVASEAGFNSQFYFANTFRKKYNKSPSSYRKNLP